MKKQTKTLLFIIAACFLSAPNITNAQSTAATNVYNAANWLGFDNTGGGGNLDFKVNSVTWMTLQNTTGNFGVGTTTPAANLHITQKLLATGILKGFIYTGALSTNQTLSTEIPSATFTTVGRQWATGALTTQREILITQPTYSFVGASTITDAATFGIAGAPIKSTNATITNTHGILVQAGAVSTATNSYGLTVNAQTGATNNYAAKFIGGNVGIGTPSPVDQLEVVTGNRVVGINTAISGISPGGVISFSRPLDAARVALVGVSATSSNDFVLYGAGGGSEVRLISGGGAGSGFGFYSGASTGISTNTAFATARPTSDLVMKITGAGNVGIGTTSPDINASGSAYKTLTILGPNTSVNSCGILEMATQSTDADANIAGVLNFAASSNASTKKSIAQIVSFTQGTTATNRGGFMIFNTKPDGSTSTLERMRIDNIGNVGIGTSSPANKLDVGGTAQMTGFKLTTSPTSGYVLTSDASGVGTWQAAASGTISGSCSSGANYVPKMSSTTAITCSQLYDNGTNVGIGTTTPAAKLEVYSSATNDTRTITMSGSSAGSVKGHIGQNGRFTVLTSNHYSTSGTSYLDDATYGGASIGLQSALTGSTCITFNLTTAGTVGQTEYMRITEVGKVGIGINNPAFKLDVSGTPGSIAHKSDNTTTWDQTSDVRLKTNITPFTDGLNIVKEINPVNYKYNGKAGTETILQHIGILAQDMQQVAPYTVGTYMAKLDSTDTLETQLLTFNPHGLFFVLINAVKQLDSTNTALAINDSTKGAEIQAMQTTDSTLKIKLLTQDSMITSMQNQLNQLASVITDCCNNNGNNGNNGHGNNLIPSSTNNSEQNNRSMNVNDNVLKGETTLTDVELSNKSMVLLNQNVANPFTEQTTISYYLPDNIQHAQILFFDQSGKIIKTIDITERGKGQLNVFAHDLSSGIYTYSLIVDGQTVETKKMVKTK